MMADRHSWGHNRPYGQSVPGGFGGRQQTIRPISIFAAKNFSRCSDQISTLVHMYTIGRPHMGSFILRAIMFAWGIP